MTTFFDTNILIFTSINQDFDKQKISDKLIQEAIRDQTIVVSPLVISEYIFVLSKLSSIDANVGNIDMFNSFVTGSVDSNITRSAFELCYEIGSCKNINDVIHLKFAEKLMTFDKDFNKFIPYSKISIEIFFKVDTDYLLLKYK